MQESLPDRRRAAAAGSGAVMYRAVLFDLGQTLLEYPADTHGLWRSFLEDRLAAMHGAFCGIAPRVGDDVTAFVTRAIDIMWPERRINMSGRSWHFAKRLRAILDACGGGEVGDAGVERLTDLFYEPIGEATRRYPETLEGLEALRAAGRRLPLRSRPASPTHTLSPRPSPPRCPPSASRLQPGTRQALPPGAGPPPT